MDKPGTTRKGKWSRRAFITAGTVAGGALLVGVVIRRGDPTPDLAPLVTEEGEYLLDAWVKLGSDNSVTAIVPHSEMGQGAQSALAQMLADELDAHWDDVRILEAPAEDGYANYALAKGFLVGGLQIPRVLVPTVDGAMLQISDMMHLQITGGSMSVRTTGVHGMRVAGAAARELLLTAAAGHWQVPRAELAGRDGFVVHAASGRRAPYGEFAAAAGALEPSPTPALKRPEAFTLMGHSVPRLDIPEKVTGAARFGMDARVDGMKYAAIRRAPVFGARIDSLDDGAARAMPGVHGVIGLDNAVAVVADGYWQAEQALAKVAVRWTSTAADTLDSAALFAGFERDLDAAVANGDEQTDLSRGDARGALERAERVVTASYRVPYLAHACMEPMTATARFTDGACELWTSTQNPLGFKHAVAEALELDADRVTVHNAYMGGGFGRRSNPDYAIQAAQLARAAGMPVQLIWSREEDIRQDHYRPAVVSRFKAALDAEGRPVAWENQFVDKHEPAEAPYIPYAIANQYVHYADSPTHVPFGPWRSVDHSQHGFFTESFIDELAHAAGRDPYDYRRSLLADAPRHRAVLDLAADKAGWTQPLAAGRGRGIALQASFGTIVAQVAEVTVRNGRVRVDRVVCAADPGFAVSPDGFTAQMESGIIYGLTAALFGEIELQDGAVVQSNFHDYPILRLDESPLIETYIVESAGPWGGAGEPGTPAIAAAVANAVFAATGTRIRELPLGRHDFDQAQA
ncbi:MAG: molybdopterin cofactor-binding domain-containing protein [Gammaproteobacteria bacterium]|nr:molybdopterin cofactor-binding domain-containing protein [Gammaproteobacteria bacterium]